MLYHAHELTRAALAPWTAWAEASDLLLSSGMSPLSYLPGTRSVAAAWQVFGSVARRYDKPEFGIEATEVDGDAVPVHEKVVAERPFARLLHFERELEQPRDDPRLLIVAPMSGHYATLLRATVQRLVGRQEVYVTDWTDAREVPLAAGGFDLDDYIDYVIEFLHLLGPDTHVLAVCQPAVPVLAAVAVMAENDDACAPASMTLIGGPIDTREAPTTPNQLATSHPLEWFEKNVVTCVPAPYPGAGRRVYPGFLQLGGFISMNFQLHWDAHARYFDHLVRGDGESAEQHERFYQEYLSVMDIPAEFYLQTIRAVFQDFELPRGVMQHRGRLVRTEAITRTALLTIEGERDDISGIGQTRAAHRLCANLADSKKSHYEQEGVGHYGVFSGRRWREQIAPRIEDWLRAHPRAMAADAA